MDFADILMKRAFVLWMDMKVSFFFLESNESS
jgi:hypothetical protein